jgi:hypothetical protein
MYRGPRRPLADLRGVEFSGHRGQLMIVQVGQVLERAPVGAMVVRDVVRNLGHKVILRSSSFGCVDACRTN